MLLYSAEPLIQLVKAFLFLKLNTLNWENLVAALDFLC